MTGDHESDEGNDDELKAILRARLMCSEKRNQRGRVPKATGSNKRWSQSHT